MISRSLVAVTTGDQDGIGPEVSVKALAELGPQKSVVFCVFRSAGTPSDGLRRFKRRTTVAWKNTSIPALRKLIATALLEKPDLIEVISPGSPALWVEVSAKLCSNRFFAGMATAPLSKTEIQKAGFKAIGHTQILERVTRSKPAFMGFIGDQFSVVLGSGHVSLQKAGKMFLKDFDAALTAALQLRALLPKGKRHLPVGVLGIDPHCGEKGIIGAEDFLLKKKIVLAQRRHRGVIGPIVPDVAFLPENWKKFSVFLTAAHDQGLIPFKMTHGFRSGIHVTLGIPIHRSSVDHGTAKDLFRKNKADHRSMLQALQWIVKNASTRKGKKHV